MLRGPSSARLQRLTDKCEGSVGGGVQSVRDTCDQFNLDIITRH